MPFSMLHISDLHFGNCNEDLKRSLKAFVKNKKPGLILATGDLAERPRSAELREARNFLDDLAKQCCAAPENDLNRPRLIVVPGNHDILCWKGSVRLWPWSHCYGSAFNDLPSSHFFEPEGVWIYGFDSSKVFRIGANGRVKEEDLDKFADAHKCLKEKHGKRFESAIKIVALHHHPLPIKQDDKHQRWLVLSNAGAFLGHMIKYGIDLILHGHEHVHAKAAYGREVPGHPLREVHVVGAAAAAKNVAAGDENGFDVVIIEPSGEVRVDFFTRQGNDFSKEASESYPIRSVEWANKNAFEQAKGSAGYFYEAINSIAIIDKDGDAQRIVECDGLNVLNTVGDRAQHHVVQLPQTSGRIDHDLVKASVVEGQGLWQFRIEVDKTASNDQLVVADIQYGRPLAPRETISYNYSWYLENAFAMHERDSLFKYGAKAPSVEFTHIPIGDPVERVTVIVRFPEDFPLPEKPEIFVAETESITESPEWRRQPEIELQLNQAKALHYYRSLRTAALRVRRPRQGYSYGIVWRLPVSPPWPTVQYAPAILTTLSRLALIRAARTAEQEQFLLQVLQTVGEMFRRYLIKEEWDGDLEVSVMVFHLETRKMIVPAAAVVGIAGSSLTWEDCSGVEFGYGIGVGGRAFKKNQPRIYVRPPKGEKRTPDYYVPIEGALIHEVLLAIPLQDPGDEEQAYGVINCGSADVGCPLREVGEASGPVPAEVIRDLQVALNRECFQSLTVGLGEIKSLDNQ